MRLVSKQKSLYSYDEADRRAVLELGAGAALPSLIAAHAGVGRVTITDYPAPAVIKAIEDNVSANLPTDTNGETSVVGLDWANPESFLEENSTSFTRILAADTLWLSSLHEAQVGCITSLLARTGGARVHVLAGLHSGRACVRQFLRIASASGLVITGNGGKGIEWDRLNQRWLDVADSEGSSRWSMDGSTSGQWDAEDQGQQGTEESRRRYLVYFELGWSTSGLELKGTGSDRK